MKFIHHNICENILSTQLLKSGGKLELVIYFLLNILVAIAALISIIQCDSKHVLACIKILIMFIIPWLIEWKLKIELSSIYIMIIQVFMYAAIILGELDSFYMKYPSWDTILHVINGFLCASAGFMIVSLLIDQNKNMKLLIKPIYVVALAFCLSMTVGVMWEFYEFGMDHLCNRDMQKDTIIHTIKSVELDQKSHSLTILKDVTNVTVNGKNLNLNGYLDIGLYDTMGDLFNNLCGTLVFCVIGYYATRKKCNYEIVKSFIYAKAKSEYYDHPCAIQDSKFEADNYI